jgi:hypothetical protein
LGCYVKTLTICLPDYNGPTSFVTRCPHLPETLTRIHRLQALHISQLPGADAEHRWDDLKNSLLHLFSLPTLRDITLESIWDFPIDFLDYFHFVQHLRFRHVAFASSYPSSLVPPASPSSAKLPLSKNFLKSLEFQFCPSQTIRRFLDYVTSRYSIVLIDDVEKFTINPWTESSSPASIETMSGCREGLKELVWALGSAESCECTYP